MTPDSARVVILGGSGYVGTAIATRLAAEGMPLRLVSREASNISFGSRTGRVSHCSLDLTDPRNVGEAVSGAAVIILSVLHAPSTGWRDALTDPSGAERVNVGIPRSVVRIVANNQHAPLVIFLGTTSLGTTPPTGWSEYERQKSAAESLVVDAALRGEIRGLGLRLPVVYGAPFRGASTGRGVVASLINAALRGDELTVWGDGAQQRDWIHVDDVADAVRAAIDAPEGLIGSSWDIGTGTQISVAAVASHIAQTVAARTNRPQPMLRYTEPPAGTAPSDGLSDTVDPRPFTAATGWSASTSIAAGIARTVDHIAARAVGNRNG